MSHHLSGEIGGLRRGVPALLQRLPWHRDAPLPRSGGEHVAPPHFRLMMACAEICRTSAHFMLIGTPHHKHTCGECAEGEIAQTEPSSRSTRLQRT